MQLQSAMCPKGIEEYAQQPEDDSEQENSYVDMLVGQQKRDQVWKR